MKISDTARILFFVFVCLGISCAGSGKEEPTNAVGDENVPSWFVTIKGKVGFPQQGQIVISEMKDNASGGWQDTIKLKSDYTFAKKLKLTEPGYYRINFYNKQVVNVILDKTNVEVNVDGNSAQGFFEVVGSPDLDLIRKVQDLQAQANSAPEVERINKDWQVAVQNKNEQKIGQLQAEYLQVLKKYNDQVAQLMVQNSPSLAVINLLQAGTLDKDQYFTTYVTVAEKLKKEWPAYFHSKNFVAFVDKLKSTAIGQVAPEISLPDPDGKIVTLSSMRGKYVLVDFWAKWCGPCRQENPNVVKAYNRFKDKGFTVFGVSLDRNREDWLKAIQDDGLTWTHVSDLKFWQSEAAKTYSITGIPFSLLLDPNGVIIAKNLRGAALHKKLEEVLGGK
ncbi:MAG TPA: TlpA disulfide reductase family protein [Chryseosolibacter sp.]